MASLLLARAALHVLLVLQCGPGDAAAAEGVGEAARHSRASAHRSANRDMVSISMFKVYEKYSKDPRRQKDGNTVRSFKAVPGVSKSTEWFQFNLSSIQDSELILSASFHFMHKRPRHHQRPWICRRSRNPSCVFQTLQAPSPQLVFRGTTPNAASVTPLGNVTLVPLKRGTWQARDITSVVKQAVGTNELLITVEYEFGSARSEPHQRNPPGQEPLSSANLPYMLVYADDRAIDEPNSVAVSLQRYGPFPAGEDRLTLTDSRPSSAAARSRRELPLDEIQTNHLPEVHFNTLKNHELWQSTYLPPKAKAAAKHGRKQGQELGEAPGKPQVLSFDEKTMKKARRRQWSEPRVCARRYLRVDFADIGWSEWVLAPKAFDAYYCAGTCGFPIPKVVRPSNHATIQSIVRAVGIVPGVPEPCCVPDKMSPLSVLFLDQNRNMVLKVYPAMSVDTCSCR
ncbi:growth/differentiation factor 10-like [Lampris incognitus]|uniref:growth/differentiation factor 10-like n=1 Tax=Lampris incognitus TaxID=2546036 RepID=UPI0024B4C2EE|nr:growth/differentiation factor 10-like [Lampris incognitus]